MGSIREGAYGMLTSLEGAARHLPISEHMRLFRAAQRWDGEELARYRDARVAALVAHAYATVPFYRRRMDEAGVLPEDVTCVADLARMPVLTREDVSAHAPEMVSTAFDRRTLPEGTSSGSTGQPVRFVQQRSAIAAGFAMERLGWEMAGWRAGDRVALVWGSPVTVQEEWRRSGARAKALLFRELRIAGYEIRTAEAADRALDAIEAFRPLWIRGYANAIRFLAQRAASQGRTFASCRGVLPTAETTTAEARAAMERAFAPVFDGYGSSEVPGVAYQCRESGLYHVMDPHVVMEFGEETFGEDGAREVMLTNLDEHAMPFIRYRIGDVAVPSDARCGCGRGWSSLSAVYGRRSDLLTTPHGGAVLTPDFFSGLITRDFPTIVQYQVAKVAPDTLEIRVVARPRFDDGQLRRLEDAVRPALGGEWRYSAAAYDSLPLTRGGKHRFVVDETTDDTRRCGGA